MIKLANELRQVKSVAISGHVRPDGDCTGSCLAVYNYIKEHFPEIEAAVYLETVNPSFALLYQICSAFSFERFLSFFISIRRAEFNL